MSQIEITTLVELQAMKDNLSGDYILMNNIDASPSNPDNVDIWEDKDYTEGEWVKYDDGGTVKTYYCTDDTTDSQIPTDTDFWAEMWVSAEGFLPVGAQLTGTRFSGSLDGQGFEIGGLFINRPATDNVGLFGAIGTATAEKVSLSNMNISGKDNVGGFVGYPLSPGGVFSKIHTSGSVQGENYTGGWAGLVYGATIEDCYSTATVTTDTNANHRGGFVGRSFEGRTRRCYSTGQVLPTGGSDGGGFAGTAVVTGIFEDTANFYDTQTSGWSTSAMGIGRTTAQMKDIKTYTVAGYQDNGITAGQEWDLVLARDLDDETWAIVDGKTYPALEWQWEFNRAGPELAETLRAIRKAETELTTTLRALRTADAILTETLRAIREAGPEAVTTLRAIRDAEAQAALTLRAIRDASPEDTITLRAIRQGLLEKAETLRAIRLADPEAAITLRAIREAIAETTATLRAVRLGSLKEAATLRAIRESEALLTATLRAVREADALLAETQRAMRKGEPEQASTIRAVRTGDPLVTATLRAIRAGDIEAVRTLIKYCNRRQHTAVLEALRNHTATYDGVRKHEIEIDCGGQGNGT